MGVFRSPAMGAQKPRPTGANRATSAEWRRNVKAAMNARTPRWTERELGNAVGVTGSAINQLLSTKSTIKSTRIMEAIHDALGLPPPTDETGAVIPDVDDAAFERLRNSWGDLSQKNRELLADMAEGLARTDVGT